MRITLQPAYVLHRRNYRDSSLIVDLFSEDYGRLSVVAKGARGKPRRGSNAALLQPFSPLLISCSGRSELKTLGAYEAAAQPIALVGEQVFSGLYLNELIVRLLHSEDAYPSLFHSYIATLQLLAQGELLDVVLRRFEFTLLQELGYGFDLALDGMSGEVLQADRWYVFHSEYGLVADASVRSGNVPAFAGEQLLALSEGQYDKASRQCAKRLMRCVLDSHLGGKPLRSRELFRRVGGER